MQLSKRGKNRLSGGQDVLPEAANDAVFGTEVVYTEQEVADLLRVKRRVVKELIRTGQLGCKQVSPRIRRISQKHVNDYINGIDNTWRTDTKSPESSPSESSSLNPPTKTATTGGTASMTPVLNRQDALQLALRMIRKDRPSKE
jgi:excisionase family DNA binding protein